MGKKKGSRKGKKAWRKNIQTDDLEEHIARSGREERTAAVIESTSNESLFFVDKSGDQSIQRKIYKHRNKVLHCDSVLQGNSLIPPVSAPKKRKDKVTKPLKQKCTLSKDVDQSKLKKRGQFDLWEGGDNDVSKNAKRTKTLPDIPAVEVDLPGCSYNPTFDDHQDALGVAVAQEMQQVYRKDLQPEPVPIKLLESNNGIIDEEDMFFLEADQEDANENDENPQSGAQISRAVKNKKLTRAELNKKARNRELLKQEAEIKQKKKQLHEINSIRSIQKEIKMEEKEKKDLWTRRTISKKERLANNPPRLGKHRFKPDRMKVLLSEEVTGSLRKLKGCYALLRDRFKSLQRRGLLEPRIPVKKKAKKMWVTYEPGTKGAREREMHAALEAEREARKHALAVVPLQS